ncbi:hypothetical protein GCM10022403_076640 [Streptomyces coacervatus]|uniref:Transposase n=1 Tax=Streptomyces coacervatus TaxID=647381 RepID=A0ABP7J108_9ACTN
MIEALEGAQSGVSEWARPKVTPFPPSQSRVRGSAQSVSFGWSSVRTKRMLGRWSELARRLGVGVGDGVGAGFAPPAARATRGTAAPAATTAAPAILNELEVCGPFL